MNPKKTESVQKLRALLKSNERKAAKPNLLKKSRLICSQNKSFLDLQKMNLRPSSQITH